MDFAEYIQTKVSKSLNDALKNKAGKKLLETLAFGVGQLKDECIVIEEIIFPNQTLTDVSVEDAGMNTYHLI